MRNLVEVSKFLSLVLRHAPERIGLSLDPAGWVEVDALLQRANANGVALNRQMLNQVVVSSDRQRFVLSDDGERIRANQGHSVQVDLELPPQVPPSRLFHGTASRFLESIRSEGLQPMERQHVHLSPDESTARNVGRRHGRGLW
jgi:putative RNA 2'-phosphotransferase